MVFDEQELRQRLEATADRVSAPRFTVEGLADRIRRRRAKIVGLASVSLLAVAAVAVAVPVALSGPSTPQTASSPPKVVRPLSVTVAVNGQSRARPKNAPPPSFTVTPGEHLRIRIGVTVPAHVKVTPLWLGVTNGVFSSPGPDGQRPTGLRQVLAHTRKPLPSGLHIFRLTWTVPAGLRRGTTLWLVAEWTSIQEQASVGQGIAELVTPPGGVMSAAQACRQVTERSIPGVYFSGVERVRLVLTRYAKGEPVESTHDIGSGIPR